MPTKCSWVGCSDSTEDPREDGWRLLKGHPGIGDGFYCPDHVGLIEVCDQEGGFFDDDEP